MFKKLLLSLILFFSLSLSASSQLSSLETLKVYFIDVGYGDAIFITLPNEDNILIDAGSGNQVKTGGHNTN